MNAIDVTHLSKVVPVGFFGRPQPLLHDVSFAVAERATVAFVGPNGAGKSTTLRHLIGGSRPTSGTVRVFGKDPALPSVRRAFGYLPDVPALPPQLTAAEALHLHARLTGVATNDTLLEAVGLSAKTSKAIRTFSKGMQTRLGSALALVGNPPLLLLDEPMSGLDPIGRREMRELIRAQHAAGKTIFFSTHVLSDVDTLCDSVVVIDKGRVLWSGGVSDALGASRARIIAVPGTTDEGLLQQFAPTERQGDQLTILVDVEDPFAVVAALRARGVIVNEVRRQTPRLEDHVLQLLARGNAP